MQVAVKLFASLREQYGFADKALQLDAPLTAAQVWQQATQGGDMPGNTLIAINHEYVTAETLVSDNDEVAFFPPVTGG